jgi:hypothetical protein
MKNTLRAAILAFVFALGMGGVLVVSSWQQVAAQKQE